MVDTIIETSELIHGLDIRFMLKGLRSRYNLLRYIKNTLWLVAGNLLRLGVGLVVGILVARYLGPKQYGLLSYAVAFVSLFSFLSSLGMDGIVVKELTRHPESRDEILGTAVFLRVLGFVIMMGTLVIVSFVTYKDSLTELLIGIISVSYLVQVFMVIDWYFQAQVASRYVVIAQLIQLVITSIAKLLLVYLHAPLFLFAMVMVLESAVVVMLLILFYSRIAGRIGRWRMNLAWAKKLLGQSWPVILSSAAIMIQGRIDQVMLGQMVNSSVVGQYSVAMRMIEVFAFIPVVICNSIAPEVTKWKAQGDITYYHGLTNLYRLMFLLFVAVAVPLWFVATPMVVFLFGGAYQAAGSLLALFGIRLMFANFGMVRGLFINNNELFLYALITSLLGAVMNIVLNYMLIPPYGAEGAIWATILSFAVTVFIVDMFVGATRRNFIAMLLGVLTPWKLSLRSI